MQKNYKKLKILSAKEYFIKYNNKIVPSIIPYSPNHYYKNKWISWPDFLGSNLQNEKRRNYLNFFDAKKFVKKLNLKSLSEWQMYSKTKRPLNIPGHPDNIYKKQWKGWYDFSGQEEVMKKEDEIIQAGLDLYELAMAGKLKYKAPRRKSQQKLET